MKTLLVVDDDYRDREGIQFVVKQNQIPLNVRDADNGEAALKILQNEKIDIMITDIRMPIMDGIELATRAVMINPKLRIIFASAHKDFEYAHKAINIGVIDYIVKPYDLESLIRVIHNAVDLCVKDEADQQKSEQIKKTIMESRRIKEDKLILDYLKGIQTVQESHLNRVLQIGYDGIQLVMLEIIKGEQVFTDSLQFLKDTKAIMGDSVRGIVISGWQCLFILNSREAFLSKDARAQAIIDLFRNNYSAEICLVFSNVIHRAAELKDEYHRAEKAMDSHFFADQSLILSTADDNTLAENSLESQIPLYIEKIPSSLQYKNYGAALIALQKLFNILKKTNQYSSLYIKYLASEIINRIYRVDGNPNALKTAHEKTVQIFECKTMNGVVRILEDIIEKISNENNAGYSRKLMADFFKIIETDYMNSISLESIARQLYISPTYLSHLVKKEIGQSFINYLTTYRLEKARDLLMNTNMPISQICSKIGYESTSYFCSLFKKVYGITPTQFRENRGISES